MATIQLKDAWELSQDLESARMRLDLTLAQVGLEVGVTRERIRQIENTRVVIPENDTIQALAKFFEINLEEYEPPKLYDRRLIALFGSKEKHTKFMVRLRERREELSLTCSELATKSGRPANSGPNFAMIECGYKIPQQVTLISMAIALNADLRWLMGDTNEKKSK